jgi:hypothetical protein
MTAESCIRYGVVYGMELCTVWSCVRYGAVYGMELHGQCAPCEGEEVSEQRKLHAKALNISFPL